MTTYRPDYRINRPGALIAAIPAVLGFVPEHSLVLIALEHGQMGAVMRADLTDALAGGVGHLVDLASASGAESVIAVIVDDKGAPCPMCNDDYRELCDALGAALADEDMSLYAAHVVDRIEAGGMWHCADGCEESGPVEDPMASPLAAAAVLDGRRLYGRRADLQAVIALADPAHAESLVDLIGRCAIEKDPAWRADTDACVRRDVEATIAAAARVSAGQHLEDDELAALACAITDVAVRDTLYALAVGSGAGEAETLWALLARSLPSLWRVEALVLLAFSAYARGDGPLAGLSLEAALRADPEHRMAGMLDTALQSGMRPEQIRELAGTGYRLAKRLGVQLPPRQMFGRRAV